MKLITTHPIKKSDLGLHNNLFGGKLLAWIDAAGAAFTTEYVDSPRLVTVMIDKCIFKKPAKEGQLLKCMEETIDGDYQRYAVAEADVIRKEFFGKSPGLKKIIEKMSDQEIRSLNRGGHDSTKIFKAYHASIESQRSPTVT